jgi:hypothetical protein
MEQKHAHSVEYKKINGEIMKAHLVTTVRICNHRVINMPRFTKLWMPHGETLTSGSASIDAPRGIFIALALSAMLWMAVIAAISL